MKAVDLFAGAGGLSLGLQQAGFSVVAAIEINSLAAESYKLNHPDTFLFQEDICAVDPNDMMLQCGIAPGELDLLAGCPPCQGFSTLRTLNGRRDSSDCRNDLVFEFVRFALALKPRALLMENVPSLFRDVRFQSISNLLSMAGYNIFGSIFNAFDFGVPQRRRRFVMLASRETPVIPEIVVSPKRTVRDAIGMLPVPGFGKDYLHDYAEVRAERVIDLIKSIPKNGGSRKDLASEKQLPCHRKCDGFHDVYGRMSWDNPAPTITTGCINPSKGRFLHPEQNRAITLREAACLQGFPRDYHFSLKKGRYRAAELIGNAFPPPFAKAQAEAISALL